MVVRPLAADDKAAWLRLWADYLAFYEADVADPVTAHTWERLMAADSPFIGLVVETKEAGVVGIVNCVLHESTKATETVCYLHDLFVEPRARGQGAGRAMIDAVAALAKTEGWGRVYWMTKADNDTARILYDKISPVTDWVRYDYPL